MQFMCNFSIDCRKPEDFHKYNVLRYPVNIEIACKRAQLEDTRISAGLEYATYAPKMYLQR